MANIVLTTITSGYNLSLIGNNFEVIQAALNTDRLQLSGGGNVMLQDLDMNGHAILNASINPNDPNSFLTLADGDARYYQLGNVPTAVDYNDAAPLGQVEQLIASVASGSFPPDDIALYSAIASTGSTSGADRVGIKDTGGYISGTTVETAIAQVGKKQSYSVDVMDFGAVGDAVGITGTNDTAAFQAALDWAHTNGYNVTMPNKRFLLDPLIIRGGVVLHGITPGPYDSVNADGSISSISTVPKGPTLLVNSVGTTPFITLDGYASSIKNCIIFYPHQVDNTHTTPNTYPFTIGAGFSGTGLSSGPGHFIEGITLPNSFNGIALKSGRSTIRNCMLGCYNNDILVDEVVDYVIIDGVIFQVLWDTWANSSVPSVIDQYVMDHGIAIQLGRCDGIIINNCGIFMRNQGLSIVDSYNSIFHTNGQPTSAYGMMSNVDMDTVVYGVVAYSSNSGNAMRLNNVVMSGASLAGTVTAAGLNAVLCQAGGYSAPNIVWSNGSAKGSWSNPTINAINAGTLTCRNVKNVNETGAAASTPTLPTSNTVYTVAGVTPFFVTISGGTVSQIAIDGVSTGLTSGGFYVVPGNTIKIVYTVAPTWKWFVR